ncbi:MAG: PilZ domain-containing protein [Deltaproteobacteria bacterium]|nr:PilZ domain-containing protein [Deltaproteobacteria bacterium]MBW1873528.1 PilZ domain-containing protein [Deltaproteobacteria bacterium]
MVERRDFKRLPAETEINIRQVDKEGMKIGTGKDISGGGIMIESPHQFEPGTLLDIEVFTRTHKSFQRVFKPLSARVRVVRVEGDNPPYSIAAEFVEVEQ